jgi:MtN3 and saliva related transmembrane protein
MDAVTMLGLAAGTLTTVALVPQFLKAWSTKSTHDISLSSYGITAAGIALWLVYGLAIADLPLILSNFVSLALGIGIVALKLKYG